MKLYIAPLLAVLLSFLSMPAHAAADENLPAVDPWQFIPDLHFPEPNAPPPITPDLGRNPDEKGIFSLIWENDIIARTDRGYTNGARVGWLSSEKDTPQFAHWIANNLTMADKDSQKRVAIAVGQSMYTPEDLNNPNPSPDDRPYAGWLYGSFGIVSDNGRRLDNLVLTLGVVGPWSYAEQTQKFVHKNITGSRDPKGWDSQLHNEPGAILTYQRKWRSLYQFSPFGTGMDVTPNATVNLGNINTSGAAGMTFRLGYDLPADYGPPLIRPSLPGSDFFIPTKTFGGYLFAGFQAHAVARDIFLDGNTFRDSPHVDKNVFVGDLQAGFALTYGNARLSYTHVVMTPEFHGQTGLSQYGSLNVAMRF
ncbi:MAG: lipid A deacylase LpxR family protein [Alphaproteobacteria bacterium]